MKSNKTTTQTPQELLDDLRTLITEVEGIAGTTLTEHSEDAISALRSRFGAAQERFSEFYGDVRKKVVAGAKHTDEAIRANPYQSLAIAAGAGLLVGVLLGRRSK
ncbi:MAG TPA: hypothetical protein VK717_00895 [Opitutaceae bacterium]|jgi:ElaB/YqjD/DUF883 family membrane-anchored ribosome-binding protein|nr:hypothetical protein [Opitutaceae bacterium]